MARGPHHPRGEINKHRVEQQQHINEHLAIEPEYVSNSNENLSKQKY